MKGSLMDHSNSHASNNNNNAEASCVDGSGGGVNEENSQTLLNMNHVRGGTTSCDSDNSLYSSMDKIMNMGGGAGQSMTNMPKMSGGGNAMCKPEKDTY